MRFFQLMSQVPAPVTSVIRPLKAKLTHARVTTTLEIPASHAGKLLVFRNHFFQEKILQSQLCFCWRLSAMDSGEGPPQNLAENVVGLSPHLEDLSPDFD